MLRLASIFAAIAIAFEIIGALIARLFAFNYDQLAILGVVIFVAMGLYAGRMLPVGRAIVAVAIAAALDASLGWWLAAAIGPARPPDSLSEFQIVAWAIVIALVDVAFAGAGIAVGHRMRTHQER